MLTLTRWDATRPPTVDNLVLMMQNEAVRLADLGDPTAVFPAEVVQRVESRLAWAREVVRLDSGGDRQEGIGALRKSAWRRGTTRQWTEDVHRRGQCIRLVVGNLLLLSWAWYNHQYSSS